MNDTHKLIAGALMLGGSLLTGNAALVTAAGGVGVNWTSEALQPMWQRLLQARRRPRTGLDVAYARAIKVGLNGLRDRYHAQGTATQRSRTTFDWVAECADGIGSAEFPPGVMDVPAAQTALANNLEALFHGRADYDPGALAFIKENAFAAVAVAFRDEMARNDEAWQRYHGWLIEGISDKLTELLGHRERQSDVLAQIQNAAQMLTALKNSPMGIDARWSQGLVYQPSGTVTQYYGPVTINQYASPNSAEAPPTATAPFREDISRIVNDAPDELFGRTAETALLNDAWSAAQRGDAKRPRVITFVALGGEGKTSLVAKWAAELSAQNWPECDAAFAWSFYSQGTREQVAVSSDSFLAAALTFFGDSEMAGSAAGAFDKGRRLAELAGARRALLILDGLEPLQYAPSSPLAGELKDQGVAALLKGLADAKRAILE